MTWIPRTAMGDPIQDIIGDIIGDLEVTCERDLDIGVSLNSDERVRDIVGVSFMQGIQAAIKAGQEPGVLPWDVGRTKAQNQRLAEVYIRFNRGEQPSERGGKRVHKGGFSLAEVNAAVIREKAYEAHLAETDPQALAKRQAYFRGEKEKYHQKRRNSGFHPLRSVSRTVKTVTNPLTRPIGRAANTVIDKVPLARQVANLVSNEATLFLTAPRFLASASQGLVTGGLKGAARGIKDEAKITARNAKAYVQNPIIRYGTKGAAIIFPALTPVAAGVEAANQLVAAVEGKDPIKAALAITTIANTAVAANGGDLEALRAIKTIKAVKDGAIPKEVTDMATKAGKAVFSIPKGADPKKAVAAAHSVLSIAKGVGKMSPSAIKAAQTVIKNTVSKAKTGDPKAKAAAALLAKVHKAQASAFRKAPPGKRGSYRKANRAAKGKSYTGAFLVDAKGNVFRGNFAAK